MATILHTCWAQLVEILELSFSCLIVPVTAVVSVLLLEESCWAWYIFPTEKAGKVKFGSMAEALGTVVLECC